MFERYTEKARRVIFYSRQEASEFGGNAIEPHHVFLALIREDRPLMARFASRSLPPLAEIRERIRASIGPCEQLSPSVDLPLSPQTKKLLIDAAEESEELNHNYLSTEHLLLGLLRRQKDVSYELLSEYGVEINTVRNELRNVTTAESGAGKAGTIDELKKLAAESRDLASAMMRKAERIEAICDQLTKYPSDNESDSG